MKTLIVVDTQKGFGPFPQNTIDAIVTTIRKHKKTGNRIITLEVDGEGPTHYKIRKAIGKYPKASTYKRTSGSGQKEIGELEEAVVCGVYTSACVRALVDDLENDTKITVLENACWDCIERDHEYQIKEWKRSEKVEVA